jgi:hypothetical protein
MGLKPPHDGGGGSHTNIFDVETYASLQEQAQHQIDLLSSVQGALLRAAFLFQPKDR